MGQRRLGGDDAAPLVAEDMGFRLAECLDQCGDVITERLERVVLDPRRPGRLAEPSHVGRHRAVSRLGERRDEVTVLMRKLREAVKEEDDRTFATRQAMEADAVRIDELGPHPDVQYPGLKVISAMITANQTSSSRETRNRRLIRS